MADPMRGEIRLAHLGTGLGHEQSGQRPVLVVSDDAFNTGLAGLVMIVPLTSKVVKLRRRTRIRGAEDRAKKRASLARCFFDLTSTPGQVYISEEFRAIMPNGLRALVFKLWTTGHNLRQKPTAA